MTIRERITSNDSQQLLRAPDGTTLGYLSTGSGPAVIMIPGALSVAAGYAAFAGALGEHFSVHTLERRGRGRSGPQGAAYGIQTECEDVLALQARTGATRLVGHSFGGLVALETARRSQVFSQIAVYEPGVSIDGSIAMGWMPGYQQKLAAHKYMDAFVEYALATGPDRARTTPAWLMKCLLPLFMTAHERKIRLGLLPENLREHQEVARLDGSYKNYQAITAEVLLMCGGKTDSAWVNLAMARLAAVLPRSQTRVFPKLDHFGIDAKSPREVAGAISDFFLSERRPSISPSS